MAQPEGPSGLFDRVAATGLIDAAPVGVLMIAMIHYGGVARLTTAG